MTISTENDVKQYSTTTTTERSNHTRHLNNNNKNNNNNNDNNNNNIYFLLIFTCSAETAHTYIMRYTPVVNPLDMPRTPYWANEGKH